MDTAGFPQEFRDRFVALFGEMVGEEMVLVLEMRDGPNLIEIVRGEVGELSWRMEPLTMRVPGWVPETRITRVTVYNDDHLAVFEKAFDVPVRGGAPIHLGSFGMDMDLPSPTSRMDHEARFEMGFA
jgi:hypothetical protein